MARDGKIRRTYTSSGRAVWNDQDVYSLAGFDPKAQVTVVYARTEPLGRNTVSAEDRLEQQKQRLLMYCGVRDIQVDVVIGEVRRVNRIRHQDGVPCSGFNALMGLIGQRRVKTLVIESRDRISVGSSWEMFEWVMKSLCGVEVLVVNQTVVTTESREESKFWIADMLQVHKIMVGEIKDKYTIEQFMGGPDVGMARDAVKRLDQRLREKKAEARAANPHQPKPKKTPVDLDELFS